MQKFSNKETSNFDALKFKPSFFLEHKGRDSAKNKWLAEIGGVK